MATKKAATTKKKSTTKSSAAHASARKSVVTTTASAPVVSSRNVAVSAIDSRSFSTAVNSLVFWRALAFELVGTFLLALAALIYQQTPLYILFALVGIVLVGGGVSGAHVNPAVTVAAWVTRRIGWVRLVGYLVAQVVGALLALVVMNAFIAGVPTPDASSASASAPQLFKAATIDGKYGVALFFSEFVGTAILAFAAVHGLRQRAGKLVHAFTYAGGTFIGLTVAYTAASYFSSTAVLNPALAFGLQAVEWKWVPVLVYLVAPLVGGIIGFGLYDLLHGKVGTKTVA